MISPRQVTINGGLISLDELKDSAAAILNAGMPGVQGGTAIAATIFVRSADPTSSVAICCYLAFSRGIPMRPLRMTAYIHTRSTYVVSEHEPVTRNLRLNVHMYKHRIACCTACRELTTVDSRAIACAQGENNPGGKLRA